MIIYTKETTPLKEESDNSVQKTPSMPLFTNIQLLDIQQFYLSRNGL